MRPKYLNLSALLLTSAGLALSAGSAHAAAVDFCISEDGCAEAETVYIENNAAATVTSVNITQEQGAASCQKVKKTVSRNSAGGIDFQPGQSFRISVDPLCKYKVVFKTTKGCTGDKTAHITPSDFAALKYVVKLRKACGTLKTQVSGKQSF